MDTAHTVTPAFAAPPAFCDVTAGDAFFTAPGSSALFSGRDVGRNLQDTLTAGAVVWF